MKKVGDKKGSEFSLGRISFIALMFIVFVSFVVADQITYPSAGNGLNFSAGQGVSTLFNITINNSDNMPDNITEVIILLNATTQINLTDGTANTSLATYAISTTNTSINLSQITINGNGSVAYLWFSAAGDAPVDDGNFTALFIFTNNSIDGNTSVRNVTGVNINDSMDIDWVGESNTTGANLSQNYLVADVNISGNTTAISLLVEFYNSTGLIQSNGTTKINSTTGESHRFNLSTVDDGTTDLPDGDYNITVIINNSDGENNISVRQFKLDTTAPVTTLAKGTGTTKNAVSIDITIVETGSGVADNCASDSTLAEVTGNSTTQGLNESGFSCNTAHAYSVTCVDFAGNIATAVSLSVTTDGCSGGGSVGGGGGSGGSSTSWSTTFRDDSSTLEDQGSVDRKLGTKQRVKLDVGGEDHHVGVTTVGTDSVTIEIASDPQTATLTIGEVKKFEVTGDSFYDLVVTLNGIESGKADLNIAHTNEEVPEGAQLSPEDENASETAGTGAAEGSAEGYSSGSSKGIWITVIVIVILVIVVWFWMKKRK